MSNHVQCILCLGGIHPKDKDCILVSLIIFGSEFPSDSIGVNVLHKASSKVRDECEWEVAWSAIVDINGVSCSDGTELGVSFLDGGDRGLWFIDKAKPRKGESESVDIEEIFERFL